MLKPVNHHAHASPLVQRWLVLVLMSYSVFGADDDLVIRHGRIVDGTGNPAYFADVAVRGGRIVAIGKRVGQARLELDAQGLVVAPGFIDVHTHAEDLTELPFAENFIRMGVTTIVTGNCGSSAIDVAGFFRRLEATRVSVNVATLVGHNSIRSSAMNGSHDRLPTEAEMARMEALVEQGMKDGALGLSTGLIYLPGTFAQTGEIIELAKVIAAHDGLYASHMRSESSEVFAALAEVFQIAREAGVRAQISHLKLATKPAWGQADQVLAAIDQARAAGLDITQDQYVYAASSTGLSMLVPEWVREGGRERFLERMKDPAAKAKAVAEMKAKLQRGQREDYSYAVIADYPRDRRLNGLTLVEAAKVWQGSDSLANQIDLILEIEQQGGATGVFHGISEDDLRKFLTHPHTMMGSDSGPRRFEEGVPHPRGYGNHARLLAHYVRELKLLRLEDALRRMTSLPATTFRLRDRGHLREGAWADIVVFDPETIRDHATYRQPHRYPSGIRHVLVNGTPVLHNAEHTHTTPGLALRHGAAPRND